MRRYVTAVRTGSLTLLLTLPLSHLLVVLIRPRPAQKFVEVARVRGGPKTTEATRLRSPAAVNAEQSRVSPSRGVNSRSCGRGPNNPARSVPHGKPARSVLAFRFSASLSVSLRLSLSSALALTEAFLVSRAPRIPRLTQRRRQ